MRVAIILPCETDKAPYIQYYIEILKNNKISYDIISWNRSLYVNNTFTYSCKKIPQSNYSKIIGYFNYCRCVKKNINAHKYDYVIIHTIVPMVLLSNFLIKKFGNNIIADIRDYSRIIGYSYLYKRFKKLITNSSLICISSPGFKDWLPQGVDYCLSHNISNKILHDKFNLPNYTKKYPIKIYTLGMIAYYDQNLQIIESVVNNNDFELHYYGYSDVEEKIRKYVDENKYSAIYFHGRYKKEEEKDLYIGASFINSYCSDNFMTNTILTNRFYLALLNGIPLIVTKNSFQSEICNKYYIGFSISDEDDIEKKIKCFFDNFDISRYIKGRSELLSIIKDECDLFEKCVNNVFDKK